MATAKVNFSRFSQGDWFCYAGAEVFSDDTDPFVGTIIVNERELAVVVDAKGIFIDDTDDGGLQHGFKFDAKSEVSALAMALQLHDITTDAWLRGMGFTPAD